MTNNNYTTLATDESIQRTKAALEKNGFRVMVAENGEEAKNMLLEILPKGAEVMENTSTTLDQIGVSEVINESGDYNSIHKKVLTMDREKEGKEIGRMRSVSDWAIGSFHAVTEDGKIMMASGSGSQLPGYVYGATNVIFVAGTHKIVKDMDQGFDRIYTHSLPLESERIDRVYNTTGGSHPRRILIMNSEKNPERTTVILVKEVLGF
jgi:L-lactate utilization protein LutC